jgi:ribosomal protein S18 acetylase RimI-like enzyme
LNVTLRDDVLPADRPPLERILRESKYFREDEIPVGLELVDDRLARGDASHYRFVVAAQGDRTVGYCCYGLIACTVHSYDIYWIAVDPAFQRSGVGRRLMAAAEENIRSAGGRRIYVETSSKALYESTRKFYAKCGYKEDAVLCDFYAPGDNKVVMVKSLEPPAEPAKDSK